MNLLSFKRSINLALKNMQRNKWASVVTIGIMASILLVFNIMAGVNHLAQNSIQAIQNKVDLLLYLKDDADTLVVNRMISDLEEMNEIVSITFIPKEEALEKLLEKYDDDLNPFQNESLENPLPDSIQIITEYPQDHERVLAFIQDSTYNELLLEINSQVENQNIANQLNGIIQFSQRFLRTLILIFVIAGSLIIANTLNMNLIYRKHELETMNLIGAPISSIKLPFMIEGSLYGLFSALLSLMIGMLLFRYTLIESLPFQIETLLPGRWFLIELIMTTTLGLLSSLWPINRFLKNSTS